jgi:large subunit ribosomal protein L24
MKIKKGDNVIVIAGKDKGKKGKVAEAFPRDLRVVVEGVNLQKKHMKSRRSGQKGQIVSFAAPMHVSNVMLLDPKGDKRTRVGISRKGDKRVRVAKKSGAELA